MVRPFVYPPSWKTRPCPGHASGSSGHSPSDRDSRSSGIASSSLPSHKTVAGMVEIFCWVYGVRPRSPPPRSQPATRQPKQSLPRKIAPKASTRWRRLRRHCCRRQSAGPSPSPWHRSQHRSARERYRISRSRISLKQLPRAHKQKLILRARPLVPKGQLWNPSRCFRISGAVSRTKTRRQNQRPRRLQ